MDGKLSILYFRFVLSDKEVRQPLLYSGVLHDIELKEKWNKFEKAMVYLARNDDKIFRNPLSVAYDDGSIKATGTFIENELFDINDSETILSKVLQPSLELYRGT